MKHDHDSHRQRSDASAAVVEVDIKNAYSGSDYACLEGCFRILQGVTALEQALEVYDKLKAGQIKGRAVLVPA